MKNSNVMCHPLFLPFDCFEIDSDRAEFPAETCVHYFAELVLVREGTVRLLADHEETVVSSGEAMVLCPGVRHRVFPRGGEPVRLDMLRFDPDRMTEQPSYCASLKAIMAEARREKLTMHFSAQETERLGLPELFAQCVKEAQTRTFGYDINISSCLCRICTALIRFWLEQGLTLPEQGAEEDSLYSLSGYIQKHLRDSLRVEDLAAYCKLSYPWFAKKFREIYGVSCKDFIEQIRVSRVEQYLRFTDMDLTAISEATGYADCSHMIKNFKRVMDITPGQYRLHQNKPE